eukprot:g33685.t1
MAGRRVCEAFSELSSDEKRKVLQELQRTTSEASTAPGLSPPEKEAAKKAGPGFAKKAPGTFPAPQPKCKSYPECVQSTSV